MNNLIAVAIIKRNLDGEHNHWILPYLIDESVFIGWIAHTDFSVNELNTLGVQGPMKWTGKAIAKCVVTKEVGQRLKSLGVNMGGFTEINKYGKRVRVYEVA